MFFWVLLCNAQNQQFEINWEGSKVFSSAVSNIELPYFDAKHYNYSKENGITFTAQWNAGFEINPKNVTILSIESEVDMSSENYMMAMRAVSNLSYNERVELVQFMKSLNSHENVVATGTFSEGDKVQFTHKGVTHTGTVYKTFKKYVIVVDDYKRVRVPAAMLTMVN